MVKHSSLLRIRRTRVRDFFRRFFFSTLEWTPQRQYDQQQNFADPAERRQLELWL